MSTTDQENIAIAKDYFHRLDESRPDLLDLVSDDVEFSFPKFGVARGKQAFVEFGSAFQGVLESMRHEYETLNFLPSGDHVVVEGTSRGTMSGKSWVGGKTPGGRFCNVFRFQDKKIASLHVYLDPDYLGEDTARFRWGMKRKW